MKLPELFTSVAVGLPDFEPFLRDHPSLPPLDVFCLSVEALTGKTRARISTPIEGDASLVLIYKGKEGAVTSLEERDEGETWNICQVQGAKSRVSYRVATCLNWQPMLGEVIRRYAVHPEADVRRLIMPSLHMIRNIEDARSQLIEKTYAAVRNVLRMRYSKEEGFYVTDLFS